MEGACLDDVLRLLVCPSCRRPLDVARLDGKSGTLGHSGGECTEHFPVIDGIPRLVMGPIRAEIVRRHRSWFDTDERGGDFDDWIRQSPVGGIELRVVSGFDDEWRRFSVMEPVERQRVYEQYFDLLPPGYLRDGLMVLDAGSGSGRWAMETARRGPAVLAVDLGFSVETAAARRPAGTAVCFVQGDLRDLPVQDRSIDFAYSLGVLHHIDATEAALRRIVFAVRPGGYVLVYLYYALDDRSVFHRTLLSIVDVSRRVLSRAPRGLLAPITTFLAIVVYWPLARTSLALRKIGMSRVAAAMPLSFYADLSLRTMRNDSLDRFGTRLEKRFTRQQVRELLEAAGLTEVRISDQTPYWHAIGRRPPEGPMTPKA